MSTEDEWSCDANDAVQITIVQPDQQKPKTLSTFHPQFTYPIFGEDERIFGYKGLIIRLRFAAHNLRPHLHVSHDEKFTAVEDAEPTDVTGALKDFLPEEALSSLSEFESAVQEEDEKDFVPPGELAHSYSVRGRDYEIWAASLADPQVQLLLNRFQIMVSFFIEAGTPLTTDDPEWTLDRWTVYFVYEKVEPPTPKGSSYSIVGYATTYRWWFYKRDRSEQPTTKDWPFPAAEPVRPRELPSRLRIAQFLILPPHQGTGHGVNLYNTIHKACLDDSTIAELTVEDPNESFDVLRDSADYQILRPELLKNNININPDPWGEASKKTKRVPTLSLLPLKTLSDIRTAFKIEPTQFAHIQEMFLLSQIPLKNRRKGGANMARLLVKKHRDDDPNNRRYYWWRMLTKQRLYKRSRDVLIQLKMSERHTALEDTVTNVEDGYEQLFGFFDEREERLKAQQEEAEASNNREQRTKRKFTVEDEDDEEDESAAAKRPKLPLGLLTAAQGHPMLVELKNGETLNGHLANCDNWMNLILREVVQTSPEGDRFFKLPEVYVRGNNIKYLRIPEEIIEMVKEQQQNQPQNRNRGPREGGRGDRGGRGGRGRGRGRGRGGN
ncbi:Histone acetyltransferase type B catalytic subunit [Aspergillus mulundensis]|uniref:Histone acetyltransferase type B catalytic subunit n=1 Tax=Aspergillus mulundensis TaxID=1810919 RepID=A0A3D8SVT9_9EURO|nr:Histone acetyltransferase type B catalytic subunit [Aspergillus mulundensis]RDW90433.1 Histone acetyltransferase type B catalytic subunit [Aspergillus mulundensis]